MGLYNSLEFTPQDQVLFDTLPPDMQEWYLGLRTEIAKEAPLAAKAGYSVQDQWIIHLLERNTFGRLPLVGEIFTEEDQKHFNDVINYYLHVDPSKALFLDRTYNDYRNLFPNHFSGSGREASVQAASTAGASPSPSANNSPKKEYPVHSSSIDYRNDTGRPAASEDDYSYPPGGREELKNGAPAAQAAAPKKPKRAYGGLLAICITIVSLALVISFALWDPDGGRSDSPADAGSSSSAEPQPWILPENGFIFTGSSLERTSFITVHASPGSSCFIKLKSSIGEDVFSFFVRAGESVVELPVPAGYYYIYFAEGDNWYGTSNCFGEDTAYSKDPDLLEFKSGYGWEYTLYGTTDGNFTPSTITADDF